jgi:hypothetical protein
MRKEAVQSESEKLIRDAAKNTQALFDLRSDPREVQDLAPAAPERAAALGALLDAHNAAASTHPLALIPPPIFDLEGARQGQGAREEMEALGYLGADRPAHNTGELVSAPR